MASDSSPESRLKMGAGQYKRGPGACNRKALSDWSEACEYNVSMTDVVVRFLADQHFRPDDTDRVEPFLQLLDRCSGEVDHLFLLGDLFDFCLGAVHIQRAGGVYADVCEALRSLVQSGR